ncbi:MAG: histidinol-phosphatase HisJ family protein [Longicatena sp.]
MIDGHMHLENGPLHVDYVMEFVNAGVKAGMDTIHILDHTHRFIEFQPLYTRLKEASHYQKEWFEKKTLEPLQTYFDLIEEVKQMDLPIEVKFGLEVCYAPEDKEFLREILNAYPYDFLIGSIHSIDGLLYDMNSFSREILWDKYDTNAIYKRYYEIMEDMICSDLFTQIGHPDQLKLFHYDPTYDLKPTYERLAQAAKEHDVYMECNTGIYYRYNHEDMGTNKEFMDILKKHGVKIMTASDAHQSKHVGIYIKEVSETL